MHESDIELTEHWHLVDPQIMAVLLAMTTDLNEGSPAGRLYGETLGTALAIHLLHRYAVRGHMPATYRGGLPGFRLKRVLDFVGDNLAEELSSITFVCAATISCALSQGPRSIATGPTISGSLRW
jgi:AraC family transcriptional regulator